MRRCLKSSLYIFMASLLITASPFAAEPNDADQNDTDQIDNPSEQEAIRQTFKDYSTVFAKHDPEALSKLWAQDGVYLDPTTGQYVKGHDALMEEYKLWFQTNHADKVEFTPKEITFNGPDEAAVQGILRITFTDKPPKENAFASLMVKENGKWVIKEARQIILKTEVSNADKLKPLSFLIGDWEDKDSDVDITFNTNWDKYENMLISRFNMKIFGQDVMEGRQIIAWDPIEKKIRSWFFDSDGGFGHGFWYENDGNWFVKAVYTLSDGRKATAVNVYKKINDNEYSWAAIGRDVNGVILPDIDPIVVQRIGSQEVENE